MWHPSLPACLPRVREKSAHGGQATFLEQTFSTWERLVVELRWPCMCPCKVGTDVRAGREAVRGQSQSPLFFSPFLFSKKPLWAEAGHAYVECLLCAGHGRGPHDESQEESTLIRAAWLDLCVPRWCPGAVVGAKRECHELAVGPSGLGGLLEEVALQRLEGDFR